MHAPDRPVLVLLHFLGGSAREWSAVAGRLGALVRPVAIDLPGFGDAAGVPGYDVAAMADHVAAAVRREGAARWLIAGHSMGAKVALAVARRAEDGEAGLEGLAGLITLAGSPPAPEPMAEERRERMLGWFAGPEAERRSQAERFVDANASSLDAGARELAVADVLRAARPAWCAWLESGSREDWRARIGLLRTPALVLAGADDADLGPEAQRRLMAPHLADARIEAVEGARHLLPLERPERVAALIAERVGALPPPVPAAFLDLLRSDRTASRLRDGLLARAAPDDPAYAPAALGEVEFATLRALLDRVLPQDGGGRIDLAARVDRALAAGEGDGWRNAGLPPDAEAFAAALRTLGAAGFEGLDDAGKDAAIGRLAEGRLGNDAPGMLSSARMKLWFADVAAAAARLYVAHPATLARMGYGGVAAGGDGLPKRGFESLGIGRRDAWEPVAS